MKLSLKYLSRNMVFSVYYPCFKTIALTMGAMPGFVEVLCACLHSCLSVLPSFVLFGSDGEEEDFLALSLDLMSSSLRCLHGLELCHAV
jgi:hypothetical protein